MAVVGEASVRVTPDFSAFGGLLKAGIIGGLAGLAPGIAPAVGLLGAIPGAAAAGGAALGVLKLGFGGIGDALKDTGKAAGGAGAAASKSAADQISAANQIANANAQVASSYRNLANVRRDNASQSAQDTQQIVSDQQAIKQAQQGVNDARVAALLALRNLNDEQNKNKLDVREATLALQQAQIDYNKTILNPNTTVLGRQQAQLNVDEATQRLKDAQQAQTDGTKALADAQKKGVEGSDQVVAAKQKEATAAQKLADDQKKQIADQLDNSDQLAAANEQVAQALRDQKLAYAQTATAATSAGGSAGGAMSKLSAIQQQLVDEIRSLKPAFDQLKTSVQNAFLPGVIAGIQAAAGDIGLFQAGLTGTATVMGDFFRKLGEYLGSPTFTKDLPALFDSTNKFIASMGDVFIKVFDVIQKIGVAAGPFLVDIGKGMDSFFTKLDQNVQKASTQAKLKNFFKEAEDALYNLGRVGEGVGRIVIDIGKAFYGPSADALKGLADGLNSIADDLDKTDPAKIRAIGELVAGLVILAKASPLLKEIGPALGLLLTPAGLVVAAVAGIGVALYELDPAFKSFVNNAVKDITSGNWSKLATDITDPFKKAFKSAFGSNDSQSALGQTTKFRDGTKNNLSSLYSDIGKQTTKLVSDFSKTWEQVFGPNGEGTKAVQALKDNIGPIFQDIVEIVDSTIKIIDVLWNAFGKYILDTISITFIAIVKVIRGAFDIIAGVFQLISDILTGKWGKLWGDLQQIVKGFVEIVKGIVGGIKDSLVQVFNALSGPVSTAWNTVWTKLTSIVSTAFDTVKTFITNTAPKAVIGALSSLGDKIGTFFAGLGTALIQYGKDVVGFIVQGIENAPASITKALQDLLKNAAKDLGSIGKSVLHTIGIPGFKDGGVVEAKPGGTIVNVGEGGEREYIVPQSKLNRFVNQITKPDKNMAKALPPLKGGGLTINIENQHNYAPVDAELFARTAEMAYHNGGNG